MTQTEEQKQTHKIIAMAKEMSQLKTEKDKLTKRLMEHGEALMVLAKLRLLYNLSSDMREPQLETAAKMMMRQAEEGIALAEKRNCQEYIKQLQAELNKHIVNNLVSIDRIHGLQDKIRQLQTVNEDYVAVIERCIEAMKGSNCWELKWLVKALKEK